MRIEIIIGEYKTEDSIDFRVNRGRNQSYGNGYDRQRTNRSERKSRRNGSMSRENDSRRSEKRRNSPSPSSNRNR